MIGGESHGQEEGREEGLLTFAQLLDAMFAQKHTGPVTLHFKHGRPYLAELPREPRRIRIAAAH